ncbi:hypothetical protein CCUS01_02947 [Colletotrichum cuscutae]|uniref:Uncharacterized protein n=3 Tax=Colletotrichum acutatum species complex TaxID=2707335 RepID=A0AAI9YSM6_9PEZI|nr:uncharacterized protein CCOS01_09852 [Colletotrichum costaricense]XP_060378509.1 uncharacterized protein CTAM01_10849 [Colletotrichum tamarilloi]KAI3547608.1 hypothetical protein CSPX01_03611 [Colletotrichum filicis]KAK1493646.1 hypothetical protein CCUS01_02947 [Colletotrichum cuscutae]KAK1721139.1 hypothetical protein BDP67DRAFT_501986 [Colletotrichum lupini]KAK1490180.1 hypothetical protein CTAM01_10849 [Colletotrichum tamarilloi]KAK1522140.1 hypothetical protein CCOS01_09852 [Colletotr
MGYGKIARAPIKYPPETDDTASTPQCTVDSWALLCGEPEMRRGTDPTLMPT